MEFQITLNDQDFIDFELCLFANAPIKKQQWKKNRYIALAMLLFTMIYFYYSLFHNGYIFDMVVISIICFILTLCFIYLLLGYSYEKEIIKNNRNIRKKYKFFYEPNSRIEFLQEEMRENTDNGLNVIKYSNICRVLKDETHIYLMIEACKGFILPFRCLNGQENELFSFIQQKINNNINQ